MKAIFLGLISFVSHWTPFSRFIFLLQGVRNMTNKLEIFLKLVTLFVGVLGLMYWPIIEYSRPPLFSNLDTALLWGGSLVFQYVLTWYYLIWKDECNCNY